jgi:hypothetical protein
VSAATAARTRHGRVVPAEMSSPRDFTVMALIAAHNEADVIAAVIGDLIVQGVSVYLLDHGSTDGTSAAAEPHLGRGLVKIESLPAPDTEPGPSRPAWETVLRRKEDLAWELEADWFLHHDADEFRESPWPDLGLRDAIRRVDAAGYDAIDFELLNFRPTHDGFRPGGDVREAFTYFEPGEACDRPQVRCWKKGAHRVDLVSFGGHEAVFPERRVFPLRFLLRHYPVRGQAHGERKVFRERRARFAAERARQWHLQYDSVREGDSFLRDPATLTRWDPIAARLKVALEAVARIEAPAGRPDSERLEGVWRDREVMRLSEALDERNRLAERLHGEVDTRNRELAGIHVRLDERTREADRLHGELNARNHEAAGLRLEVAERSRERDEALAVLRGLQAQVEAFQGMLADTQRRLLEVLASRTWRWSGPLRTAAGWFSRR